MGANDNLLLMGYSDEQGVSLSPQDRDAGHAMLRARPAIILVLAVVVCVRR